MASARIDMRLDEAIKTDFERAAAIRGQSLTDYMVSVVQASAKKVILQHERMTLDNDAFDHFFAACDAPNEPNQALRDASQFAVKQGFK